MLFLQINPLFPGQEKSREGLFLPLGINVNYNHGDKVNFGIEAASVYFYGMANPAWIGAFMDFTTDTEDYRFSIGSKFGYAFFGCDLGYAGIFTGGGYRHAVNGRFLLTLPLYYFEDSASLPLVAPYARYTLVMGGENFLEYGILIKYSFRIYDPRAPF